MSEEKSDHYSTSLVATRPVASVLRQPLNATALLLDSTGLVAR